MVSWAYLSHDHIPAKATGTAATGGVRNKPFESCTILTPNAVVDSLQLASSRQYLLPGPAHRVEEIVETSPSPADADSRHAILTDVWGLAQTFKTVGHYGRINRAFADGSVATKDYRDTDLFTVDHYHGNSMWQTMIDR